MKKYESFGECVRRCLEEEQLSASEAARLVGFRSRNSIFRILSGDSSVDVKMRFLNSLREVLGAAWPERRWEDLQEALSVERLGPERYETNQAFRRVLHEEDNQIPEVMVQQRDREGRFFEVTLAELMKETMKDRRVEIIVTGCCDSGLARLLEACCGEAGANGTLTIRHYIDTEEAVVTQNILGILPLICKPWYNARLVAPGSCPSQMQALYRAHALYIHRYDASGAVEGMTLIRYDDTHFFGQEKIPYVCPEVIVLDRWRFHLELLKPMPEIKNGPETFITYTDQCAQMEKDCAIYSIKPDLHFNCIPSTLLEQAVLDGFRQSGMAAGPELVALIDALKQIHDGRFANMMKHKPTYLIYSYHAMERFMNTGVQSDHLFIQRRYTVEERRGIIRSLIGMMKKNPWFNVRFLREGEPELYYEITLYDGRGVLLMDAYTGYELNVDHSEAMITLPAFMESFKRYFEDELLTSYVLTREESLQMLEHLLVMKICE